MFCGKSAELASSTAASSGICGMVGGRGPARRRPQVACRVSLAGPCCLAFAQRAARPAGASVQ
eukprot:360088-Lingulodinium_polyedra.AAC.1